MSYKIDIKNIVLFNISNIKMATQHIKAKRGVSSKHHKEYKRDGEREIKRAREHHNSLL